MLGKPLGDFKLDTVDPRIAENVRAKNLRGKVIIVIKRVRKKKSSRIK